MKSKWARSLFILVIGLAAIFPPASRADNEVVSQQTASAPETRIYMLRGLFGIFSLGIDQLAAKLKAQGYHPQIVGWEQWGFVAGEIIENHRRGETGQIILIGHSLGSDSTIQIAGAVQQESIPIGDRKSVV